MTDQEVQLRAAPSKEAIVRYLMGEPKASQAVLKSFLERSLLIGAGILVLGKSDHVIRNSLAASLAIELYLLRFYGRQFNPKFPDPKTL
jgi:hypothetical protein